MSRSFYLVFCSTKDSMRTLGTFCDILDAEAAASAYRSNAKNDDSKIHISKRWEDENGKEVKDWDSKIVVYYIESQPHNSNTWTRRYSRAYGTRDDAQRQIDILYRADQMAGYDIDYKIARTTT